MNTRLISHEFEYHAPQTLQKALELLSRYGPQAKILAGGTDLVGHLKFGKRTPAHVIDIKKLEELKFFSNGTVIKIGAGNNFKTVQDCFAENIVYAGLYESIYSIGKTQVLNMATVGGNLANGSPKADTAPPLLTYDARIKLVSLKGERTLDLKEFHTGPNKTVMADNEILTEIEFDALPSHTSSAFEKTARVGADISKITCAVTVAREGSLCKSCRIACGAAAPVPMRMPLAEEMMIDKTVDEELIDTVALQVGKEIKPPSYGRTSQEYRRHMVAVMFRDGFWRAWEKAGGENS
jgi:CO/xanthine dehydrogenase FAD-binding subunit